MYLSSDLITSVKRRCNVPTSQITFQTADFLALADEEIRAKLLPLVLKTMEEFYVSFVDYNVTAQSTIYAIPPRATAMALRSVMIVSSTDPDTRVILDRLNPEDLYAGISGNARFLVKKNGFYLQGNSVILYPTPYQSLDILRLGFYSRPNQLVDATTCGLITGFSVIANTITVSTLPSNITSSSVVDLVRAVPGFECTAIDQTISGIVSNVITMASSIPSNIQIGDYVCPQYQSCVVQVPVELQPLLFQYVVVRILAAQGDQTNLKAAVAELESLEKAANLLLSPRVSGNVKRVTNSRSINRWV